METIIAYTSGSSRGNPGPAAAGVFVTDSKGQVLKEVTESLGNGSADFAEYYGVMLALQTLAELYKEKTTDLKFELRLDSELVKKQLNGEEPIKSPGLVPMFIEIHNMQVESFPDLTFAQVTAKQNKKARQLVSQALDDK